MKLDICNGDVMAWTRTYSAEKFHAMLCDPPYHLHNGKGDKGGFMNSAWDGGQLAFQPETWAALAEHLHPGAFLFAFAGTRGYHRMACAMEDAGLIIHPALGWVFSTGFPKATRIDTQIDKAAGAEREVLGTAADFALDGARRKTDGSHVRPSQQVPGGDRWSQPVTAPATDLARAWAGHRYGLQAMKPAFEFIAVAQKPYRGRPVDSITETGAGALWIDGARIGSGAKKWEQPRGLGFHGGTDNGPCAAVENELGRWPPNLALLHSPLCNGVCAPGCPVAALDKQSGVLTSGGGNKSRKGDTSRSAVFGTYQAPPADVRDVDSGGASRFFHCSNWNAEVEERLAEAEPVRYAAKVSSRERNAGCEGRALENWMEGHTAPIPQRDERDSPGSANPHPCLKPISLIFWLSRLLAPPAEYAPRRLLIPFSGAGSEIIGAGKSGQWEHITAIEQSAEYCDIAQRRIRHHLGMLAEVELQVLGETA